MAQTDSDPELNVDGNIWNHYPSVPIQIGGIFRNILNPFAVLKGIAFSWFGTYVRGLFLGLIVLFWFTIFPEMEEISQGLGLWIFEIYAINLGLMLAWTGGLHLYFYTFHIQNRFLEYDVNSMQKGNKFKFGDQVWDNMFWSLTSSLTIWTVYECGFLWLWSQGIIPKWSWDDGAIWFIALFILIPFWDSLHFYVVHRILHWKWIYKYVHSVHHRNINVGPWSGMSMHPIEGAIYLSVILIHLILPSHPLHIAFHISWYALGPAATHCGFEAVSVAGGKYPRLGDFFHQLHHRFFECNYGNSDVPLDNLSNSFHDGTRAGSRKMRERMKLQRKVRQ